jgi:Flp pilus assembly protein TadD
MGRSFFRPGVEETSGNAFYHQPSGTYYQMEKRQDGLYQRRWRLGYDGKPAHVRELRVDYVLGSGNHARTYLHRTPRGALLDLPFAWYSEGGGTWTMGPGYDRESALPPRTIAYECMFCHNAYPKIPPGHDVAGTEPLYTGDLGEGIDCQRCHGPGAAHVRNVRSASPKPDAIRASILNPARLPSDRAMEICLQCHLETTSLQLPHSIQRYSRGPFSYRPGEPLGDFMIHFDRDPVSGFREDFEIVNSAYRLRQSPCFLRSEGKLTCTTCHNPHDVAHGEAAVAGFDRVCQSCHPSVASSSAHAASRDCAACHMPKRRTADVIHAVMTDHRIQRRAPANALAPVAEREETGAGVYQGEVVPYYPAPLPKTPENALYTAVAQVAQSSNLAAGLPRLAAEIERQKPARAEFYIELGQALLASGKAPAAVTAFEHAVTRAPNSPVAQLNLADALTQARQPARAITILNRAILSAPRDALLFYQLGIAQGAAGQAAESIAAFEKSIALDPDFTEAHNLLGAALAGRGEFERAAKELMRALEIHPDHADAQANLGRLFAAQGDFRQAAFYLEKAVRRKPGDAEMRTNYAVALGAMNRFDEAREQIDAAVKADPKAAGAHNLRGSLLERTGAMDESLAEFLEAARLKPDFGMAHFNAARLLAARGDIAGARSQLQKAGADPDPRVRQRAAAMLQQLPR